MDNSVVYRQIRPGEQHEVCDLVTRVFGRFVAPDYSEEGVEEFLKYARPESLAKRAQANHFVLVAESHRELVGVIEVRNHNHISLLFVDERYQRRGIGKGLVQRALEICQEREPTLMKLTVNSSPNAVSAYERMGFEPQGQEETKNGIRHIPMAIDLREDGGG